MNRDNLLFELAMELGDWPTSDSSPSIRLPKGCAWARGMHTEEWIAWPIKDSSGRGVAIGKKDWRAERLRISGMSDWSDATPEEDEAWLAFDESRIDRIAQSDGSGDHYGVSDGSKFDTDKPMMGLIPPLAEEALARVLTFGAKKYAPDNWRKVEDKDRRYMDAMLRHLNAHRRGEKADPETGESHLAHAACCVMFMLELEEEDK